MGEKFPGEKVVFKMLLICASKWTRWNRGLRQTKATTETRAQSALQIALVALDLSHGVVYMRQSQISILSRIFPVVFLAHNMPFAVLFSLLD